jgi:hypothetical protein
VFHIGPGELFVLFFLLIPLTIIPGIFYVLTLYRALTRCAPESRVMEPGLVWLLFVPLRRRGAAARRDTGRGLGLAMSILACAGFVPLLGILGGLACLVCWILYWVRIADLSRRLAGPAPTTQPVG